jgi:hypothetical protein
MLDFHGEFLLMQTSVSHLADAYRHVLCEQPQFLHSVVNLFYTDSEPAKESKQTGTKRLRKLPL